MQIIKTEQEYEAALERAYDLMQLEIKADSAKADELELLTLLIEHYEKEHYAISPPSPVEAINFDWNS